jgi:hypothetical protein
VSSKEVGCTYRRAAAWQPRRSGEPAMSPAASGGRIVEAVDEEDF